MSESPTHCPRLLMSIRLFYHFLQFTFRGWSFIIYFFIYPLFDILYFSFSSFSFLCTPAICGWWYICKTSIEIYNCFCIELNWTELDLYICIFLNSRLCLQCEFRLIVCTVQNIDNWWRDMFYPCRIRQQFTLFCYLGSTIFQLISLYCFIIYTT